MFSELVWALHFGCMSLTGCSQGSFEFVFLGKEEESAVGTSSVL